MAKKNFELTEGEWAIISAVWDNEPCAAPTVQEKLAGCKKWTYSTVKTMMDRMAAKGLLRTERIRNLILYRPYFFRVPDQSLIADGQGDGTHHVQATRGEDYAFIYIASGRTIKVDMGKITGDKVQAWWYNPRTGEAKLIGAKKNQGKMEFDPPGKPGKHNDWILVLDDASKKFSKPGRTKIDR